MSEKGISPPPYTFSFKLTWEVNIKKRGEGKGFQNLKNSLSKVIQKFQENLLVSHVAGFLFLFILGAASNLTMSSRRQPEQNFIY